jgi:hypothetical protein
MLCLTVVPTLILIAWWNSGTEVDMMRDDVNLKIKRLSADIDATLRQYQKFTYHAVDGADGHGLSTVSREYVDILRKIQDVRRAANYVVESDRSSMRKRCVGIGLTISSWNGHAD